MRLFIAGNGKNFFEIGQEHFSDILAMDTQNRQKWEKCENECLLRSQRGICPSIEVIEEEPERAG